MGDCIFFVPLPNPTTLNKSPLLIAHCSFGLFEVDGDAKLSNKNSTSQRPTKNFTGNWYHTLSSITELVPVKQTNKTLDFMQAMGEENASEQN